MPYLTKFKDTLYNKGWLEKAYESRNANQVARILDCDRGAVLRQLAKFGIPVKSASEAHKLSPHPGSNAPRPRSRFKETLHNLEWLTQRYSEESLSCTEMARLAGCSIGSVTQALVRNGFQLREAGEIKLGKPNFKRRLPDEAVSTVALRKRARKLVPDGPCVVCGEPGEDVNHKDRNPRNYSLDNLELLCQRCHSGQHNQELWAMIDMLRERGVGYMQIHEEGRRRLKSQNE